MKLAICGHGRAGKDEAAKWFNENTTVRYSGFSTSAVIAPYVASVLGISEEEAFRRRHEDRQLWYEIGNELREHDPAFLARKTFEHGDIAVGIRDRDEMQAVLDEEMVDLAIWIERDVPPDPTLKYGQEMCDVIVLNTGELGAMFARLEALSKAMGIFVA